MVFWVTTKIGLQAQKTHQFSHCVQCCSSVSTLCLKHSVLAPVSLSFPTPVYPVCSDWSVHTCLSQHSWQQQSSCAKSIKNQKSKRLTRLCECAICWRRWHNVTELKPGLLTRRFGSSVFCGRLELLFVWTLAFFTFMIFTFKKGALCGFGDDILIRWERSASTDSL